MPPGDSDRSSVSPNTMLLIGLVVCAAVVVIALVSMRFSHGDPPPPAPTPTVAPLAATVNTSLKFGNGYYRALVEADAQHYKIPAPSSDALAQPLVYANELAAPHVLKADRDQLDTPHLHLATHVRKEWAMSGSAARMRVEHMLLTITNKSAHTIAYRVETHLANETPCRSKGAIAQNAIALKPGETIERSECLWSPRETLEVRGVEVLELPDIGYYYVSRLLPYQALLDERSTQGHEPPNKIKTCTYVPWREIHAASETKDGVSWADVVDFYARHNCDEYSFFTTYRRWTTSGTLPAQATAATPGAP
jgi:hypothetical protein